MAALVSSTASNTTCDDAPVYASSSDPIASGDAGLDLNNVYVETVKPTSENNDSPSLEKGEEALAETMNAYNGALPAVDENANVEIIASDLIVADEQSDRSKSLPSNSSKLHDTPMVTTRKMYF